MCGLIAIQLESDSVVLTGTTEACEQGMKYLEAQIRQLSNVMDRQQLESLKKKHEAKQPVSWIHRLDN